MAETRPARVAAADVPLLLSAAAALALAALTVAFVPFRRIARRAPAPAPPAGPAPDVRIRKIARTVWAVRGISRRVPWRAKCFEQALATRALLARAGIAITLHYGVARRADGTLEAHVWATHGGVDVIGGENKADFTEMTRF